MLLTSNLSEKKTELFSEHYNSLYSVAFSSVYSKIGNYHDAEDICQEVFLRFYRKLDEIESPRKWIFGALRLVVFDYYKRKGKNDIDIETMFEDVSMSFVNGFRDTRMVIQQALDGLYSSVDETERALFDLTAVHGFSLREAALHLGLSYKQARIRYDRASRMLMDHFRKAGINSLEDLL
ncbi:MAG TPA: RNA polymerase sigma factor [Spirochaetota bacterium]|nr:RNA polymerase sigma factor [Spirochaetota bacterium]HOD15027.1 RNA polymerase sigma factor [Spirochaetota bacterium]HPG49470.1 RNA polymerase sigma factor [Spirochaetota bacterium]HPN11051.1 RNA polymerase sigma factor [Spirochaetota bacterium]HQL83373.1 RNA polymerase sigma factor [Spirochaetota bacterium]